MARSVIMSLGRHIATGLSVGVGSRIGYLLLTEARRIPELGEIYKNGLANGTGLFRAALDRFQRAGLLPELPDLDHAARLCLSMMTDVPRIRAAIGEPMTAAEIEAHIGFAADLFLRGCGYRLPGGALTVP